MHITPQPPMISPVRAPTQTPKRERSPSTEDFQTPVNFMPQSRSPGSCIFLSSGSFRHQYGDDSVTSQWAHESDGFTYLPIILDMYADINEDFEAGNAIPDGSCTTSTSPTPTGTHNTPMTPTTPTTPSITSYLMNLSGKAGNAYNDATFMARVFWNRHTSLSLTLAVSFPVLLAFRTFGSETVVNHVLAVVSSVITSVSSGLERCLWCCGFVVGRAVSTFCSGFQRGYGV
ncbi:hypothetical protein P280DRAFT_481971 [Massarina eburnea CBS 473.64]|uniref:Uncharacterized protein n=1 Tax=Massarina eburnea CBS 473.64 TaxID=1395130 RepID=A0A6A6RWQ7_9PLEO|nr:hypothetical protein P280DRAFT_481971 [Massarina eburnea CBS 473.64]